MTLEQTHKKQVTPVCHVTCFPGVNSSVAHLRYSFFKWPASAVPYDLAEGREV